MKIELKNIKNIYSGKMALISSIIISGYWLVGNTFNVYTFKILGAVYEILWIFMIPLLFAVPVVSAIFLILNKFKNGHFYLMSIVINMGTFLWLIYG